MLDSTVVGKENFDFSISKDEMLLNNNLTSKSIKSKHSNDQIPRPFVKWVGGKRQLLSTLNAAAPKTFKHYYEPFIGGGAFMFSMLPRDITISDMNGELINCYQVIKDDVQGLIRSLKTHKNTEDHFYDVRAKDLSKLTKVQRASRFIFLNKTCFNGLYRENKSGQFNTPFGRYAKPNIVDIENLLAIHDYLNMVNISIHHRGYEHVLNEAQYGDFVYFDPPYAPLTKTANFAAYVKGGFNDDNQAQLANAFKALSARGVNVMLSNSNAQLIHDLYAGFKIEIIHATRAINCKGGSRGKKANEVLITNY